MSHRDKCVVLSLQQPVKINLKNEGLYLCMYVQVYFSLLMYCGQLVALSEFTIY